MFDPLCGFLGPFARVREFARFVFCNDINRCLLEMFLKRLRGKVRLLPLQKRILGAGVEAPHSL